MRLGLGACQVQLATTTWKNKPVNFTSLVALNFPPEYDVLLFNFSRAKFFDRTY